ncbi:MULTISPECIES: NUDIX hydrolase [unclassified Breznakia]|uniref:NUDIX domain-containing protein n=1 Tax=unclassified Breznakia TaxID=2623764 RepID=UPI002474F4A1|nr:MULTISPECIES: NUDIX hydrolase [unclassified Breznakia]MDH6368055.1 ADP-ribose pyrophosphatase [Breznakia sp. PH1-1]MDH6405143.1 ADP-ribose pyrophosphatase [Breznakia sp. PF1-11]MDH6412868.1 ADP-ribose pyrophosphatase [Breznakia sp. PFB1-11]MDH6415219.1 ADP-ribose pyrophosphatase [Breznakia sp. PFB1-14]MDH6417539.1 ADP-ribose pyrophosphatase [Breznakia sp. PFB1-4]
MYEKTLETKTIYTGKILDVSVSKVELEDGKISTREVAHNTGGVCVLALDPDENIIMVRQFRYPSKEELYELAGGKHNENETHEQTGMRELLEETGYVSSDVTYMGYLYPTVAYADEVIHMVLARNCVYHKQQLDPGEFVHVEVIPLNQALEMISNNVIKDGKTIVAILKYMQFMKK